MLVQRAEMFPVECVVRGYISGSAWKEYKATGKVCGIKLPAGLKESDAFPEPIFTPATKATTGHDDNISFDEMCDIVGVETASHLRDLTLRIYKKAADYARQRGIIIADTKFEFGRTAKGITLADEVLTPDSSRFWPADKYAPGKAAGFVRQAVRSRLPRGNSLEQATARAGSSPGRGAADQRKISRGVPPADRTQVGCVTGASVSRPLPQECSMTPADWIICFVLLLNVVTAAMQGFFSEALTMAGLVVGYIVAAWHIAASQMVRVIFENDWLAEILGFLIIFFAILILFGIAARIARWVMKKAGLSGFDRFLGGVLGLLKGGLMVAVLLMGMTAFTPTSKLLENSQLAPYFLS